MREHIKEAELLFVVIEKKNSVFDGYFAVLFPKRNSSSIELRQMGKTAGEESGKHHVTTHFFQPATNKPK